MLRAALRHRHKRHINPENHGLGLRRVRHATTRGGIQNTIGAGTLVLGPLTGAPNVACRF